MHVHINFIIALQINDKYIYNPKILKNGFYYVKVVHILINFTYKWSRSFSPRFRISQYLPKFKWIKTFSRKLKWKIWFWVADIGSVDCYVWQSLLFSNIYNINIFRIKWRCKFETYYITELSSQVHGIFLIYQI